MTETETYKQVLLQPTQKSITTNKREYSSTCTTTVNQNIRIDVILIINLQTLMLRNDSGLKKQAGTWTEQNV